MSTLSNETCVTEAMQGNGLTTNWPFEFNIPTSDAVTFIVREIATGLEETIPVSQLGLNGINNDEGGSIDYPLSGEPLSEEYEVYVARNVPYTQATSFGGNQGGFLPSVLETQLNRIVMQTQQNRRDIGRALLQPFDTQVEEGHFFLSGPNGTVVDGGLGTAIALAQQYALDVAAVAGDLQELLDAIQAAQGQPRTVIAFVGDGSRVAWDLGDAYRELVSDNLDVYLGAGHQSPDAWSIDAGIVTFVDAPPDGVGGEFVIFNPAPFLLGGMQRILYDPTGVFGDAFDLANAHGNLPAESVSDASLATTSRIRNKLQEWNIFDFIPYAKQAAIVAGTSTDDHLSYLQDAADAQVRVLFPPLTFNLSDELVVGNGAKFFGSGAMFKARNSYTQAIAQPTRLKYIGVGGADTCVVRLSRKAVGSVGTNFGVAPTDDLVGVVFRDFHIDANSLADFGAYMYRCGNNSGGITRLTVEKAKEAGIIMLGMYSQRDLYIGAYFCEKLGIIAGIDRWSWGTEYTVYDCQVVIDVNGNGTAGTFILGDAVHDRDGAGAQLRGGRGTIYQITAQGNDGRAYLADGFNTVSVDGPFTIIPSYIEGNGGGPLYDYSFYQDGMITRDGFLHPGSGSLVSQDIKLVARNNAGLVTNDNGPTLKQNWARFQNLRGAIDIDSNTSKFFVEKCDKDFAYPNRKPMVEGTFVSAFFKANSGFTDTRETDGCTLSRTSTPAYRITFDTEQSDSNYGVTVTLGTTTVTHEFSIPTRTTTYVEIRFFAVGALSTPVDPDIFVNVTCQRRSV